MMDRAVVLGGSVAGLLAARVMADHASEVVIVERDDLAGAGVAPRRGVPQGHQVHGLLVRGLMYFEAQFPGITQELYDDGAEVADPGTDLRWYIDGVAKPPSPVGTGVACTRPFLEAHLRRRVMALPGVRALHGRAEGLTATAGRVDGVTLSGAADEAHLGGDVVVDCTGRSSRIDDWLAAIGFDAPPRRSVQVELGYASRFFARSPAERLGDGRAIMSIDENLDRARGVAAFPVEGGRWLVTIGGYHHDRPSSDPADYGARLAADPCVALHQFADRDDAIGDVITFRYPTSMRREFDRCRQLPGGFLALGDSVASFDPIYGQGMTSAALQSATLGDYLASGASPHEPATRYFRRLRPVVNSVWKLSTSADFRLPHVTGDRPPGLWATHRLNALYTKATLRDADLHGLFLRVLNLQVRPEVMARPDNLVRAVLAARRPLPAASSGR